MDELPGRFVQLSDERASTEWQLVDTSQRVDVIL
jgi:hypothetical protein